MVMPLNVEVKRWIQTHLAHTNSYICPVQKYGAFSYMSSLPTESGLYSCSINTLFCSGALSRPYPPIQLDSAQPEGHERDSAFLGLKWADDQICSSSHWNKGQLTESIWSWLELLWLGQWRIQPPSCGRMAKVQWSIRKRFLKHCYLWLAFIFMFLVVQIWTEKGELNAVLCTDFHEYPEGFVLFCFLSPSTSTYILPFHFSRLQPAALQYLALLVDTWCYSPTRWNPWVRAEFSFLLLLWTRRPAEEPQPSSALYLSRDLLTQDTTLQTRTFKISFKKKINVLIFTSGRKEKKKKKKRV